jgi:hypothetical protein
MDIRKLALLKTFHTGRAHCVVVLPCGTETVRLLALRGPHKVVKTYHP